MVMINWIEIGALGTFFLALVTVFVTFYPQIRNLYTRPKIFLYEHNKEFSVYSPELVEQGIPAKPIFRAFACFFDVNNKGRKSRKIRKYSVRITINDFSMGLNQVDDRSHYLSRWGSIHAPGTISLDIYTPEYYLSSAKQITADQRQGISGGTSVSFLFFRTAEGSNNVKFEGEGGLSLTRKIGDKLKVEVDVETEDSQETFHSLIKRVYLLTIKEWNNIDLEKVD
jgi:hypothetical protein